jgi:hypothetical protein
LRGDELHFGKEIAVRVDEGQVGGGEFFFNDDGVVFRPGSETLDARGQVVGIQIQAVGDGAQVFGFQGFAREDEAVRRVVIDDHAAVAVEDLAAGRRDGQLFDAVALGLLVVELMGLDLQSPEAGDEEQENGDAGILEDGYFHGGEFDVFAAGLFAG